MAEASRFASSKLSTKGRKFAARITEVEEQTKTWPNRETGQDQDVTQLMIRFERPDGKYELEWYRIPDEGDITTRSDLGKLINYFAKAKITDIGLDDYKPIRDLYVWCEVFPRTNRQTNETTDKRFPIAVMTSDEIAKEFGSGAGAAAAPAVIDYDKLFGEVKDDILTAIDGLPVKAIFSKIAAVPAVANHENAEAIFEEAHGDGLVKWFSENGHIKVEDDKVVLLSDNGTASEAEDATPVVDEPAEEATAAEEAS